MRTQFVAISCAVLLGSCSYIGGGPIREASSPTVATSPAASETVATTTPSSAPPSALATRPSRPDNQSGFVPADEAMQALFQCGILGRVAAYFRVPEGNDIWDHFPKMGRAPEIEGKSALFVAVYDGEVSGLFSGRPGASRGPVTDALCVLETEGGPNIYADVSREGMQLPPGAYVAAPGEWLLPTPPR